MNTQQRPVCLLIAALGGEGGGLLTSWIVAAADACDLPVQSTSIPGVAQRTGATTYYIEIFPQRFDQLDGPDPVMGLYPAPGRVDLMVASEILEAARAMESGFISPDRTTLVASTHRVFAIAEKSSLADGRYDRAAIDDAMDELTQTRLCADFRQLAEREHSALNAVLLGLVAASGKLPITSDALVEAIRERGVAVEANLRGFHAGLSWTPAADAAEQDVTSSSSPSLPDYLGQRINADFPAVALDILRAGAARTLDFQDADYARLYLDRLARVAACEPGSGDHALLCETARALALWMTYEDIIRVADLKTRPERYARVRAEIQAKADEPVLIREFLKPGADELAAVLPERLGRALRRRRHRFKWMSVSLRVGSHSILGHRLLRVLAGCRRWRPNSLRWREEQILIKRWLDAVCTAAPLDHALAMETAHCATLNKGYGDTFERGRANFLRILESLVEPALNGGNDIELAARVSTARNAALSDDTGTGLEQILKADVRPESAGGSQNDTITNRRIAR